MIKTITLPSGRYKLTKQVAVVKNTGSNVLQGSTYTGLLKDPTVVVGECFFFVTTLRDSMRTSLVEDFDLLPGNKVSIKTLNSVYLLEEI